MKAKINGIEVEGTPQEIAELINLCAPQYNYQTYYPNEITVPYVEEPWIITCDVIHD